MHKSQFAPAFIVARAGYDVWLGNTRGNKYSHDTVVSKSNYDKWNFDFEVMGDLDITTEIDYVLKITGQEKVAYIGHSQGTSQMYYGLSHNEQFFLDRVSVFIALGPVMQLTHCKSSLIHFFAAFRSLIIDTAGTLGFYEFFSANWLTTGAMRLMCGTIPQLCEFGLFLLTDEDPSLNDPSRTQVYLGHFPAGTSLRSLDHYG
jgi:gastric triacylglycerol lipase